MRPHTHHPVQGSGGISQFSRTEIFEHAQGLGPRRAEGGLAMTPYLVLPSGPTTPSALQTADFAAQYLAYSTPCQRLGHVLADVTP